MRSGTAAPWSIPRHCVCVKGDVVTLYNAAVTCAPLHRICCKSGHCSRIKGLLGPCLRNHANKGQGECRECALPLPLPLPHQHGSVWSTPSYAGCAHDSVLDWENLIELALTEHWARVCTGLIILSALSRQSHTLMAVVSPSVPLHCLPRACGAILRPFSELHHTPACRRAPAGRRRFCMAATSEQQLLPPADEMYLLNRLQLPLCCMNTCLSLV